MSNSVFFSDPLFLTRFSSTELSIVQPMLPWFGNHVWFYSICQRIGMGFWPQMLFIFRCTVCSSVRSPHVYKLMQYVHKHWSCLLYGSVCICVLDFVWQFSVFLSIYWCLCLSFLREPSSVCVWVNMALFLCSVCVLSLHCLYI
jgi:hypothetical protein